MRLDLSETYRVVQGSHAVCKYALEHYDQFKVWNNGYIIYLGVQNLIALRKWDMKLMDNNKIYSVFREPDLDNQETAIACYDDGKIFDGLRLA